MRVRVVITVSQTHRPELQKLIQSLELGGYDYTIRHNPSIGWDWGGWNEQYKYCTQEAKSQGYTHIIYTDGFDTLALAPFTETVETLSKVLGEDKDRMIYSVEKHWFPHEGGWEELYHKYNSKLNLTDNHRWRYVNGGQYAGSVDSLIWWYENAPKERNNQAWANAYYAKHGEGRLKLDFNCELFQTLSHSGINHNSPEEFGVDERRLINKLTGTKPCFVHNNGIKNPKEAQFMYDILGM